MSSNYSIVMRSFSGKWTEFEKVAETVFGRDGLDVFSLALFSDKHLPAEIADRLELEQAEEICDHLRQTGAVVEAIPTGNVSDVRYRAGEVWADRCADGRCFVELEGIITQLSAINARENMGYYKGSNHKAALWEIERGMNHFHPANDKPPKQAIEVEIEAIKRLAAALRKAYPEKAFTLSHVPNHEVRFWQTTPDSPRGDYHWIEPQVKEKCWCWNCSGDHTYHASSYTDPRFDKLEWGTCDDCGEDIIVRNCEKLTFVGP